MIFNHVARLVLLAFALQDTQALDSQSRTERLAPRELRFQRRKATGPTSDPLKLATNSKSDDGNRLLNQTSTVQTQTATTRSAENNLSPAAQPDPSPQNTRNITTLEAGGGTVPTIEMDTSSLNTTVNANQTGVELSQQKSTIGAPANGTDTVDPRAAVGPPANGTATVDPQAAKTGDGVKKDTAASPNAAELPVQPSPKPQTEPTPKPEDQPQPSPSPVTDPTPQDQPQPTPNPVTDPTPKPEEPQPSPNPVTDVTPKPEDKPQPTPNPVTLTDPTPKPEDKPQPTPNPVTGPTPKPENKPQGKHPRKKKKKTGKKKEHKGQPPSSAGTDTPAPPA